MIFAAVDRFFCGLIAFAFACSLPAFGIAGSLPNGATSLVETHGDWQLNCVDGDAGIVCAITQTRIAEDTGQQIIAVELRSDGNGGLTGVLVMPFGLSLGEGVLVGIDDQEANAVLGFSTCLPMGCIVPVGFDASVVAAFSDANNLLITATANDTGDPVTLPVSLNGLTAAFAGMEDILANGS